MSEIFYLISAFAVSFALTLLFEFPIAILFRLRWRELSLFFLVNILTNPAAVYLNLLFRSVFPACSAFLWQIPIEAAVILAEGFVYLRYSRSLRFPWIFAAAANVLSYALGLIITMIL